MKAKASQNEASREDSRRLVALPEKVELQIVLPENAATEAELLDRLIGQQIIVLFEGEANRK
ncbi:hypothetical protein HKD42_11730 [Altererythrobacter sp. RZ02]|uniref:Uncharacterized protein n=1 Tax=Pontixanthobacter rizhaonensis TaxID=2730337 RepID=A0A848QJB5_9SPHN|nr:hypothetical protein [Pontixanthobacter rizhaonensis]NMW32732.1 hypothetical protein [Pontixanthobacter rizhaonensis]